MSHALYERIVSSIDSNKVIDIQSIACAINNGIEDTETLNMIQSLIIHHNLLEGKKLSREPYNSKIMRGGRGIIYNTAELPPMLIRIIEAYITGSY